MRLVSLLHPHVCHRTDAILGMLQAWPGRVPAPMQLLQLVVSTQENIRVSTRYTPACFRVTQVAPKITPSLSFLFYFSPQSP